MKHWHRIRRRLKLWPLSQPFGLFMERLSCAVVADRILRQYILAEARESGLVR